MRKIIVAFLLLLVITAMAFLSFFMNGAAHQILPEGSYTSAIRTFREGGESYSIEQIMLSVIGDKLSLHIQREIFKDQEECLDNNLYAIGNINQNQKGLAVNFIRVIDQKANAYCSSVYSKANYLTQPANFFSDNTMIFTPTFQDHDVYCFDSENFGAFCLKKES